MKFRSISLKRQRPHPDTSQRERQKSSQIQSSQQSILLQQGRQHQPQQSSENSQENNMPKSSTKANKTTTWLTPRPIIVSMLNNKGVIFMERQQYGEARKSLNRALRLAEKEDRKSGSSNHNNNSNKVNANIPATTIMAAINNDNPDFEGRNYSPMELCRVVSNETSPYTRTRVEKENATEDNGIYTNVVEIETDAIFASCDPNHKPSNSTTTVRSPFDLFAKNNSTHDNHSNINDNAENDSNGTENTTSISRHRSEYDEGMDNFKSPFRLVNNSSRSLNGII